MKDAEVQTLVLDAKRDFGFNTDACLFTADVATKIINT